MNTDSEIRENVRDALNWDAAVDSSRLKISVRDGIVTLEGQVRHHCEKLEARHMAQCVAGVRGLVINMTLNVA